MAHFALINEQSVVTQVIVADQAYVNTLDGVWIQTSYNTQSGKHLKGGTPLRKNYAGVGYTYDSVRDAFIPPKPYPSWTLNEETCNWLSPIPYPNDGKFYTWDENNTNWREINFPNI